MTATPGPDLTDLQARIAACTVCDLHAGRTRTVPGDGDPQAEILFIGEAPGFYEDQQGRPFVGQAGRLLDKLLLEIGRTRADVFVANTLKCRPPNNRDPLPAEIQACRPFLREQIALIRPKVIVTLGRFAMNYFLPQATISRAHGRTHRAEDGTLIYPLYHPAAALRQGALLAVLREDFQRIPEIVASAARPVLAPDAASPSPPDPADEAAPDPGAANAHGDTATQLPLL